LITIATLAAGGIRSQCYPQVILFARSYPQPVDKPLFVLKNEALPMEQLWITCEQLARRRDLSFLIPR
jgi:hypothetical protein